MNEVLTSRTKTDSAGVEIMPPTIFYISLISGFMMELIYSWSLFPDYWLLTLILGMTIAITGAAFMMWGHGRFQRFGVNIPTNLPTKQLITEGAHSFSRNPMYVGFIAILLGLGIAMGSLWLIGSTLMMGLYLACYVIPREEAYLVRTFGEEYEEYRRSVRRWI